jgi:succinate dehydrogenase/fumarate reductase-like Fe-S protein
MTKKTNSTFKQVKNIPVIRQLIEDEKKQIRKLNTVMDRAERQNNKKEKQDYQKQKKERQNRIRHYQMTIEKLQQLKYLEKQQQKISLDIAKLRQALLKK